MKVSAGFLCYNDDVNNYSYGGFSMSLFYEKNDNKMLYSNLSSIESIKINKLFGSQDVVMKFDKAVNIYVGENGLGKTSILNCIYYLLTNNIEKLSELNFNSMKITFSGNDNLKKDYVFFNNRYKMEINKILKTNTSIKKYGFREALFDYYFHNNLDEDIKDLKNTKDVDDIYKEFYKYFHEQNHSYVSNKKILNEIQNRLKEKIIYLPTYRRIEIDLQNKESLPDENQYQNDENEKLLIKFGMSDVKESVDNIVDKIRKVAVNSFNSMNRILLKEYTNNVQENSKRIHHIQLNYNDIELILNRINMNKNENTKNKILSIVKSGEIDSNKYLYLKNFLYILIKNSEEQKILDNKINSFVRVCNEYLVNKRFVYDPMELKLEIFIEDANFKSNKKIALSDLSSGEKQIVSLFSKLYLDDIDNKKYIVIIDEPELSLSLFWQEKLLPDIMKTEKCALLIAVTHSPFIFRNEFDQYTKDIKDCINRYGD